MNATSPTAQALNRAGRPSAAGATASETKAHAPDRTYKDVWSRSGSKYLIRAITLLVLNILLFSGVGMFSYWIRGGVLFAPGMDRYADQLRQTFDFFGESQVTLGSLLLRPISIQDVPMQIPILGLLMATLIAIPILHAMLYRIWAALPFLAIVAFLAVMPWLAITLALSCLLATAPPFRTPFRFTSALLGLVPVVVYLILASRGTAEEVAGQVDPVDQIKFVAPWVLAVVAAAVVFALVLGIARLVDYRPGAIAPLLALMFVAPVVLFEFHVGRDELYYRWLESLAKAHFEETDASEELRFAARRAWQRHPFPKPRWEQVYEIEEEKWQMALAAEIGPFQSELVRHQQELAAHCDWFHRYFPHSRYIRNVLYLKARALDTRVDATEFRRTKWIRFHDDLPSEASRPVWRMLAPIEEAPVSAVGAVALLRLAQLDARDGDVERALAHLDHLLSRKGETRPNSVAANTGASHVLAAQAPEASLDMDLSRILLEAGQLHDLLAFNRDPLYGFDPLCGPGPSAGADALWYGLLDLDPRSESYASNLVRLKAHYPRCRIEDNIDLEIAKAAGAIDRRMELLRQCVTSHPRGDAVPEALFRLSENYRTTGKTDLSDAARDRLLREHPDTPWARLARNAP